MEMTKQIRTSYGLTDREYNTYTNVMDTILGQLIYCGIPIGLEGLFKTETLEKGVSKKQVALNKRRWRNVLKQNKNFYFAPEKERRCISPKPKTNDKQTKPRATRKTELIPWGVNMATNRRPAGRAIWDTREQQNGS